MSLNMYNRTSYEFISGSRLRPFGRGGDDTSDAESGYVYIFFGLEICPPVFEVTGTIVIDKDIVFDGNVHFLHLPFFFILHKIEKLAVSSPNFFFCSWFFFFFKGFLKVRKDFMDLYV